MIACFACTKQAPLDSDLLRRLRAYVRVHGEHGAMDRLGIARLTLARCLGALPVRRGTALLVRTALDAATADRAAG